MRNASVLAVLCLLLACTPGNNDNDDQNYVEIEAIDLGLSVKWANGSYQLTKYCFTDNKRVLDLEDDAAHMILGGSWRMPTEKEWSELIDECAWKWSTRKNVDGYIVTGPNGNSIFLPCAGCWEQQLRYEGGHYWSSSLDDDDPHLAISARFDSKYVSVYDEDERCCGFPVRAVTK